MLFSNSFRAFRPRLMFSPSHGKDGHPSVVGGETLDKRRYAYVGLTHSPYSGHKKNLALSVNPNPSDKSICYMVKNIRFDDKQHFVSPSSFWKLSEKDSKDLFGWFMNNPDCIGLKKAKEKGG